MDAGDPVAPGEVAEGASRTTGWIWSLGKALLTGAAVLGFFFLVLWVGIVILLNQTMGQGELGTTVSDAAGEYVRVSAGEPLVTRTFIGTTDPLGTRFDGIRMQLTVNPIGVPESDVWLGAVRVDGATVTFVRATGPTVFTDELPESCASNGCIRTYVLALCWRAAMAGQEIRPYFRADLLATNLQRTANVDLELVETDLDSPALRAISTASGC